MTSRSRGFVLAPVIWMLAFLAALAGVASRFVQATSSSVQASVESLRLDEIARSAVAFGVENMDRMSQPLRGGVAMRLSDARVRIDWTNESARVDLNLASGDLLYGLFLASGADAGDAQDYVDRVMQRRRQAAASGGALAAAFPHPAETARLGLPQRVADRVDEMSTVYGSSGAIDPRLAPDVLVASLPGMTEIIRRTMAEASDLALSEIRAREAGGVGKMIDGAPAKAVRFSIEARMADLNPTRWEIVLVRFFDDAEPFRILYWKKMTKTGRGHAQ